MIQLTHLKKSYTSSLEQIELFRDLSYEFPTNSFTALMGASGAGKSTLVSLMAGLMTPESGSICFDGRDITRMTEDERTRFRGSHISFIFQSFELVPNLTVEENIDLVLEISGAPRRYTNADILDRVGLTGKEKRFPIELSGGEMQRVAIARAFVLDVPYLFADEPTGNLDEGNARKIMDLISELHEETKNTIVMITHDGDIARAGDRVVRLQGGELHSSSLD